MKKLLTITILLSSTISLASCGTEKPLTEAEQAQKYNMTVTEYKEMKDAAARMNMTIEEHMKHSMHSTNWDMDMSDDSHMIEDDGETMRKWEDMPSHNSDKHGM